MVHVLLLAFNEAGGIEPALRRLNEIFSAQPEPFRFVVVDDGSTDETPRILERLGGELPLEVLRHPVNRGVAGAFDTGLRSIAGRAAADDAVITLEGDNTNDPTHALGMLAKLRAGHDVVCASRYAPGGRYVGFPGGRHAFSLGANGLMRLVLALPGIRDYTIFYRAYRASVLQRALARFGDSFIRCPHFAANVEILMRCALSGPLTGGEVPLVYRYDLKKGASKMRVVRNTLSYGRLLGLLAAERLRTSWLCVLAPLAVAAGLGAWGSAWGLPSRARLERVLPGADTVAYRSHLAESWAAMRQALGPASLLSPKGYEEGFSGSETVAAGWSTPPPELDNTARSFYLRSCDWDEPNILYGLSRLRPWRINPGVYWYGTAYLYPLAAWIAAGSALTPARLRPSVAFYLEDPARIAWLYRLGRGFTVFLFVVMTGVAGAAGAELGGEVAGTWAALFCAVAPSFVAQAHIMKPHLMANACVLATLFFCARALRTRDPIHLVAAGAAGGLAAGAAMNQGVACLFIPLALWLAWRRGWIGLSDAVRWTLAAAAAAVAVFLLANPFFVTQPLLSLRAVHAVSAVLVPRLGKLAAALTAVFPSSLSPGIYVLALLGTVLAAVSKDDARRLAGLAVVLLLPTAVTLYSVGPLTGLKYFAGAGLLPVAAGLAVAELWERRLFWGRQATAVFAVVAWLAAAATSSVYSANFARDEGEGSTRWEAGVWLERNVPAGAEVGLLRAPQPLNAPWVPLNRFRLKLIAPDSARLLPPADSPEWLVLLYPGYDDRPALGSLLDRYELAAAFDFTGPSVLRPPRGDFEGNAPVEVYRRRG